MRNTRLVDERVYAAGKTPGADTPDLVHRYAYDALGRRTAWGRWTSEDVGGGPIDLTSTPERLETWTHDAVTGNVATHDQPEGLIAYAYDAQGRLRHLDAPGGGADAVYRYDAFGRLSETVTDAGFSRYHYDAAGQRVRETHGGGTTYFRTFDEAGRLETLDVTGGGADLSQTYTYFGNGQRSSVDESGVETSWTYDAIGRLVSENLAGTTTTWGYDLASNRVRQDKVGVVTTYAVDDNDRLLSTTTGTTVTPYAYDEAGRMLSDGTTDYRYDLLGRLDAVDRSGDTNPSTWDTTFGYNSAGRRAIELDTASGDETTRLFDNQNLTGHSQLLIEDAPGTASDVSMVFADRSLFQSTGGNKEHVLVGGHGNVEGLIGAGTAESYTYDAWGDLQQLDASVARSLHLSQGERYDKAAGGHDHRGRLRTGHRWTQTDSYLPGPGELWDANLHGFVGGDVINKNDPTGMISIAGLGLNVSQMASRYAHQGFTAYRGYKNASTVARSVQAFSRAVRGASNLYDTVSAVADAATLFRDFDLDALAPSFASLADGRTVRVNLPEALTRRLARMSNRLGGISNPVQQWLGELVTGLIANAAGFTTTDLAVGRTGIDSLMKDPRSGQFVVLEAKGGSSRLEKGQMRDRWIRSRLNDLIASNGAKSDTPDLREALVTRKSMLAVVVSFNITRSPEVIAKAQKSPGVGSWFREVRP